MRALFTADLQTEWSNIPQCKLALKQIIKLAKKHKVKIIALIGDLKQGYNPIDGRVIQFWQSAIKKWRKLGFRVIIVLGNHDRFGMYDDENNWLSILKLAGAEVFDKPEIIKFEDSSQLGILPFTTSIEELRKRSNELSKHKWNNKTDILVCHIDISECKYNKLGERSHSKLSIKELHCDKYLAIISGHIHLPQKIGDNFFYVGSPFCQEWGEANQEKRFLIVTDDNSISDKDKGETLL